MASHKEVVEREGREQAGIESKFVVSMGSIVGYFVDYYFECLDKQLE